MKPIRLLWPNECGFTMDLLSGVYCSDWLAGCMICVTSVISVLLWLLIGGAAGWRDQSALFSQLNQSGASGGVVE